MAITYTPTTNFGAKDSLPTNDPDKVIKGSEFTTEFTALQTAFSLAAPNASPTFTGTVTIPTADINGGAIDGTTIGGTTPAAATFTSVTATTADINGGSIDGTVIGAATPAAGSFTTGQFGTSLNVDGTVTADGLTMGVGNEIELTGAGEKIFASSGGLIDLQARDSIQLYTDSNNNNSVSATSFAVWTGGTEATATSKQLLIQKSGDISFYEDTGTTPKFFWDASAESLGIGTTSPAVALDVSGGNSLASRAAFTRTDTSSTLEAGAWFTAGPYVGSATNHPLQIITNDTERMRIDSAGNVGIGVTPSAWGTAKALQAGTYGALSSAGAGIDTQLSNNCYYDGTNWKYIASQEAFRFQMNRNTCAWFNASAGSAGANISFTQAMTLDSSGRLLVGTTSNLGGGVLQIDANSVGETIYTAYISNTSTSTSAYNVMRWAQGAAGSARGMIGTGGSATGNAAFRNSFVVGTQTSSPLVFATADAERMRIDSSGNLLVGTTAATFGENFKVENSGAGKNCAFFHFSSTDDRGVVVTQHNGSSGGTSRAHYVFLNSSSADVGSISVNGTATAYNTSSDYRLKDVDGPITNSGAYIDALKPVQGSWKADGSRFIGLIAHEVQEVSETQIATGEKDGEKMQGMSYSAPELIANLIAEIQSLRARVAQLEGA